MSILSMLIANPMDGGKKPWNPWYGYLLLVIVVVGIGLYIYQRMNGGPMIPTLADPATLYENTREARERQEQDARSEAQSVNTSEALSDVAKAALAILQEAPIVWPNGEDLSGDAVAVAAWIEAKNSLLRATVIEDPSVDEIAAYLAEAIPVYAPVMFAEETTEHWEMLDTASYAVALEVMVGNRVVVVQAK